MNHDFISLPNSTEDKCIECGYPEIKHGDNAICDCCDKIGNLQIFGKGNQMMLLTRECMEREKALLEAEIAARERGEVTPQMRKEQEEYQRPELQEKRLAAYNAIVKPYEQLINEARKIDEQLHLSSDIFTAKTISIEEIRKAIWNDTTIPNDKKFFEFVAFAKQRINQMQRVIFELDKNKIEAYSEQKAWHVAMNDFANKLRKEEREQLRIQDVTYDVKMPKPVTPRAIKTNPKKVSKEELRKAVSELNSELVGSGKDGIQEFTVSMVMVSKGWTLEQTINHLRRSLKEGMSENPKRDDNEDDGLV